ncbi:FYVE-domain-containing protein [Lentinula raphanica]|nr:FYVE-domain-containing protein [Lentinula raphanica]
MNSSPNFKNSKAQRPDLTHHNLSHHLSLAPDFRVPTHEAAPPPFSSLPSDSHAPYEEGGIRTSRTASISGDAHSIPTPHFIDIDNGGGGDLGGTIGIRVRGARWERDEEVSECRECRRRFGLLLRRVSHCRRCGKIFCDRCSSYRALLDPEDVSNSNHGPAHDKNNHRLRVCQTCFEESTGAVPRALSRSRSLGLNTDGERVLGMGMERVLVQQGMLNVPSSRTAQMRRETSSQLSDLAECPVCSTSLDQVGTVPEQEAHVKRCLEGGGPGVSTGSGSGVGTSYAGTGPGKYLVYKLPKGSVLIGVECVICLEEFTQGSMIARLSCFCSFHNACLSSWLQRGKACPVHAR